MSLKQIIIENPHTLLAWILYVSIVLSCSFAVRIVSALLRAVQDSAGALPSEREKELFKLIKEKSSTELAPGKEKILKISFGRAFRRAFLGNHEDPIKADYWFPFWIGAFELFTYPFLMSFGLWSGIALWITLKTLPQWKAWTENRPVFNRFLIGTALVFIFSFLLAYNFPVVVK